MISRRSFLKASTAAVGAGLGLGLYTWRFEPHWLAVVERTLPIDNLPSRLVGARLAQLSDLHIGPRVDDDHLIRSFERVKEYRPEIVVYTGDFTSHEPNVYAHARRVFEHLPLGSRATYGILGNHDYGPGWKHPEVADRIASLAQAAGVRVLRNEVAGVDGLQVVGLDDLWADRFDPEQAFRSLDPISASLVLSHNPDTVDREGWGDYSGWILADHTHGGQCKPPFLRPPLLPVQNRLYTSGVFALSGKRKMYINRGVGHLLRVRFNVRPEVTIFHLARA